ncbi:hypothetical protein D3P07_17215 [Paenibacillus sp. 1011MAR3C5]|nr:hypothetical protein D3P07_17215 [Paenibacillus sp. 1011MAR3C5]
MNEGVLNDIPRITIQSGDSEIPFVSRVVNNSDNPDDRSDAFETLINNKVEIPYLQIREKIQLILEKDAPVSQTLYDEILNENGTIKYNELSTKEVVFHFNDKIGTFILAPNLASQLSSNSQDYEPGKSIRGFTLICNWENKSIQYSFIVRSDAEISF